MNRFLQDSGVELSIIGGPMYPCSNPELVAAVSEAGGLGVIQPISLTYVHGYAFREGIRYIQSLTSKPIGMNVLIEKSSFKYKERMQTWISIALEEGVRFFITSLGKPDWVCAQVHEGGGKVYHDVTESKWAQIAVDCGVDGLICVNGSAGGHAGDMSAAELFHSLEHFGLPLVCAGGIGDHHAYTKALAMGYEAVQIGTALIATQECKVPTDYKQAIVDAKAKDIVYTLNMTGVKVSVINTPYIQKLGLIPSALLQWMLTRPWLKKVVRLYFMIRTIKNLKGMIKGSKAQEGFYQAGKSVEGVQEITSVEALLKGLSQTS